MSRAEEARKKKRIEHNKKVKDILPVLTKKQLQDLLLEEGIITSEQVEKYDKT